MPQPPRSTHALILAGGAGTRMPSLPSNSTPKPLLPLNNRPLLFYALHTVQTLSLPTATIIAHPDAIPAIQTYLNTTHIADPLVISHPNPRPIPTVIPRPIDATGTADALRDIPLPASATNLLVLSVDTVCTFPLAPLLAAHHSTPSICTILLHASPRTTPSKKPSKHNPPPPPTLYTIQTPPTPHAPSRLLALHTPSDLTNSTLRIPPSLHLRYPTLHLRSDLSDPHVYLFHIPFLRALLHTRPAISSLKYDLVPYLARRQHVLSRSPSASLPADHIRVSAVSTLTNPFVLRANTVATFLEANLAIAAGRLDHWLQPDKKLQRIPKKRGSKPPQRQSPFASAGARVSVTPDSTVGSRVVAGDRTSVKRSVIADDVRLGNEVKISASVLMSKVCVEDGVNLAACVVCEGATVGCGAVLKDCRVAAGVHVPEGTEENGRDFGVVVEAHGEEDAFEFF